jgi:hypothetical protein
MTLIGCGTRVRGLLCRGRFEGPTLSRFPVIKKKKKEKRKKDSNCHLLVVD